MQLHHLPWFCVVTALFPTRLAPLRCLLNLPAFAMTLMVLVLGVRPSLAQDTNQVSFGPISMPGTSVVFGPDNVLTAAQLTALGSNGPYGATPAVKALAFPAAPGQAMVFSVSGLVGCCSVIDVGPDGYSESLSNIESLGSISGYSGIQMALLGVFTNGDPQGAAPGNYNYSLGFGQATFAPQLNQVFFIGDGLTGTGSGSRQLFRVPNSATELWLGFADGYGFIGSAAAYGDNPGSLSLSGALGSPEGTGSGLSISSSTLQFGTIPFSTAEVLLLTITNTATAGTATIGTTINGPSYKILTTVQNTCQSGVEAGQSCTLPVEFSPATIGLHNDFLTLTSSTDAPLSTFVRLDGNASGVGTEIETPLNFGTIPAHTTAVLPLTITNVGVSGTVTIGTAINGNSFEVLATSDNTCLAGISAGQSCTLPVEFAPTSVGAHNEQLTLTPTGGAAASVVHLDGIESSQGNPYPPPYINSGDNTNGFSCRSGLNLGCPPLVSEGGVLIGSSGGWYALPVEVTGDFTIQYDVYGDSGDVDSHFLIVDDATNDGVDCRASPEDTDTPSINIFNQPNLNNYYPFYFPTTSLATAETTNFPNETWTHLIIIKRGNVLSFNVGGQIISSTVTATDVPPLARLGLGFYATQNLGGAGLIWYRNISVVEGAP